MINAVAASAAALLFITAFAYVASNTLSVKLLQMLSPLYTAQTRPTRSWNGLPEGYKFDPYLDLEHPFDRVTADPWSSEGQYGHYMGIQANTINDWGCGPDGPLSCTVGTTPSQHFSTKGVQMLSPLYTKNTQPTRSWNGLPEGYKFDPYLDLEHPFDRVSADPWSGEGQYGHYMGIQGNTINDWGCGPDGPLSCTVGTTPSEHYARRRAAGPMLRQKILRASA